MTKDRICATDETRPEPVSSWENRASGGTALCAEILYEQGKRSVQELRERQAAYLASLPTEPGEVISSARDTLCPGNEDYPENFEEALHLSNALLTIVKFGDLDETGFEKEAAIYLADKVSYGLRDVKYQIERTTDILGNIARVERDEKISENRQRK